MLVGRERETRRLEDLLDRARGGRSASVIVRGDVGMGKSALLAHIRDSAVGFGILSAVGVESEADLPFAGLVGICRPIMAFGDQVPERQRAALAAAFGASSGGSLDRFTAYAGFLGLLGAAAEAEPRLVLGDDVQWLDTPSAEALLFAARRLAADRVAIVLATRAGDDDQLDLRGVEQLHVAALETPAAIELLRRRYDSTRLPDDVAERLVELTGGSPLALVEVPALLAPGQLSGAQPLPDPLPVGDAIRRAFRRSIEALPPACRDALLLLAADEAGSLERIATVLASRGQTLVALEPAERGGLIRVAGSRAEFRHPILRAAVYRRASPAARRSAHRSLAEACGSDPSASDARSWHLAATTLRPDEPVAAALEASASAARGRGAHASAATALERAVELTPDPGRRARRRLVAAESAWLAGQADRATRLLDEVVGAATDPLLRADAQLLRARVLYVHGGERPAHSFLLDEARRVEGAAPDKAAAMFIEACWASIAAAELDTALEASAEALRLGRDLGEDVDLPAKVARAAALLLRGHSIEARALLLRAEAALAALEPAALALRFAPNVGVLFLGAEEYEFARLFLGRMLAGARALASPELVPNVLACFTEVHMRTGDWAAAYACATEGVQLAAAIRQEATQPFGLVQLARLEAAMGDEQARVHADAAEATAERRGIVSLRAYARAAAGLLELGRGDVEAAIVELEQVDRLMRAWRVGDPNVLPWMPDLVEAYVRAGRHDDARRLTAILATQAERTAGSWAHAVAARCTGLLENPFDDHFERAFRFHDLTPTPFERARTELAFGERLRRAGRRAEARTHLRAALQVFDRLGAAPWRARAAAELGGSAERLALPGPGVDRLSPQELQVALLVADGATNREVAAALFVTTKTVEFHLRNVYRKLEIRSRTELATVMARRHAPAFEA